MLAASNDARRRFPCLPSLLIVFHILLLHALISPQICHKLPNLQTVHKNIVKNADWRVHVKIQDFPVFFLSAPGRGIGRSSVTMPGTPATMPGAILPDTMDRHLPGARKMPPITPGIIAASERFSRDKSPRTIPAGGPAAYWFAGGASSTGCLYSTAHCSACVGILFGECQKAGVAARSRCFFAFCRSPAGAPGLVSARCGGRFRTGRGAGSSPPALS